MKEPEFPHFEKGPNDSAVVFYYLCVVQYFYRLGTICHPYFDKYAGKNVFYKGP